MPSHTVLSALLLLLLCVSTLSILMGSLPPPQFAIGQKSRAEKSELVRGANSALEAPPSHDTSHFHLADHTAGQDATTESNSRGHGPRDHIGSKQGETNLSALSLSLVLLACLFCCICIGSIIAHERRKPEEAITIVTPAGQAVGLDQLIVSSQTEKETPELKQQEERKTDVSARAVDPLAQSKAGQPLNFSALAVHPAALQCLLVAPSAVHPHTLKHYETPSPEGSEDEKLQPETTVKLSSAVLADKARAPQPMPAEDQIPYQPTIILHAQQ
jgi:hypothetical protein